MKKLLFIAGEPGSGKSEYIAKPLDKQGLGLTLHTDAISQRAAKHYVYNQSLGCKWQLWKLEFDRTDNYRELETALYKSMEERKGPAIDLQSNLICEGVLSGHPRFRQIMQTILPRLGFTPGNILTLSTCVSREQLQQNLQKRNRPEDRDNEFVKTRSEDYQQRLKGQPDIPFISTTDTCLQAAVDFLNSATSNAV